MVAYASNAIKQHCHPKTTKHTLESLTIALSDVMQPFLTADLSQMEKVQV